MVDHLKSPPAGWLATLLLLLTPPASQALELNDLEYFETRGANVLIFSNAPGGMFNDAKTSGVEIIHHGIRTATNGDVRLQRTPEQWDPLAETLERVVHADEQRIEVTMRYAELDFEYRVSGQIRDGGVLLSVHLDQPLPEALVGRAGFNLEFLPAEYWDKTYLMDGNPGAFPRYPSGLMDMDEGGITQPQPLASGRTLVLAPEDPLRRVSVTALEGTASLNLYDGRNKAQNGWYVVRSLLPAGRSGTVAQWHLRVHAQDNWLREPVISHSQVGYHPAQSKRAVIELDRNDSARGEARLLQVNEQGELVERHRANISDWGSYLRYDYATFDFSQVRDPGVYMIEYRGQRTNAFRIAPNVFDDIWHLTLDLFFPIQMDHVKVREAYRVWHGASHLDDAIQAPPNYEHFDLYRHGEETDSPFETFEHIPGLNIGGWYDAGDYDIRTQSQYFTVQHLVHAWEQFGIERDNTTVSQEKRYVEIHVPDGNNDILQQIEHGTLALIAQHRALGHAIPGIVAGNLYQYPHLGDGITKSDNKIYNPALDPWADERLPGAMFNPSTDAPRPDRRTVATENGTSGAFDDRWAFTTNTSALNYGSAAALAAASRALRGYNDELAEECLTTALGVWEFEQGREPNLFRHGNTTGGLVEEEQLKAAVELLKTTGDARYARAVRELLPQVRERFGFNAAMLALALPYMDDDYRAELRALTVEYARQLTSHDEANPYGVPITTFGWAGNSAVIGTSITSYYLHKAFPDVIDADRVYRGLNYILGTRPGSNMSFVSGVGARSQTVAYGMNRADFSFVPGGIVPGVLVLPPDFPENKENWPFFWGQNEYVITVGASYLFLANAVRDLLAE